MATSDVKGLFLASVGDALYSSSCGILAPRAYVLASVFQWTSVHSSLYMHTSLGCVGALPLLLVLLDLLGWLGDPLGCSGLSGWVLL